MESQELPSGLVKVFKVAHVRALVALERVHSVEYEDVSQR